MTPLFDCILFDLDGTLADTAPDLGNALNRVLVEEGCAALPTAITRPVTSQGVRGLLRVGFELTPEDSRYRELADRLLAHYAANICEDTRLFAGMDELLAQFDALGQRWGIVTNKHARFTDPLVAALGLADRAACVVSGDTASRPKPFPDSLLHACALTASDNQRCVYVGDDIRDIEAGRAASMGTIAAAWGYLGQGSAIEDWGADRIAERPQSLRDALASLG
ncbi:HAD family hydrolase [Niveibacterium terrae]|uniref:HAD family hydrolase n=1 Tax=Niveibacterium terrae TaxID=3373598 RepID=UPI003A8D7CC3